MQTQVSSISQLEQATVLKDDDLFIVSTPYDESRTGYKTVSLRMKDFQEYLSAYIEQSLCTEIANIAGNVYSNQNIINTIRGSLQQTINTYIHDITGDVNVVISSVNNVSGNLEQIINTDISKINGAVSDINNIQNFITSDYAEVSTSINQAIQDVSGDIYSENGVSSSVEAIQAYVNNTINQQISRISGNVFSENSISSWVWALSAHVQNKIDTVIDRVLGDVTSNNSIFSQVSGINVSVENTINDLGIIQKATRYPIITVGIDDDGNTVDIITLRDRHVNVLTLDDGNQKKLYIEPIQMFDGNKLSRDFILYLQVRKGPDNSQQNLVLWDGSCIYIGPDDDSVFLDLVPGTDYIYYFSEIDHGPIDPNDITSRIAGTFYVSRQEIAYIDAPDSPESERPAWLDGDESPE